MKVFRFDKHRNYFVLQFTSSSYSSGFKLKSALVTDKLVFFFTQLTFITRLSIIISTI